MSEFLATSLAVESLNVERRHVDFHSSVWGNHFLGPVYSPIEGMNEKAEEEVKQMKAEVKDILLTSLVDGSSVSDKLEYIYQIQRLGIAYHFEKEIEQILDQIHKTCYLINCGEDDYSGNYDLHTTCFLFLLLRQQGYNISCNVFNKFKDSKGGFTVIADAKELLDLYEVCHMSAHGEDILDEALIYTVSRLKTLLDEGDLDPSVAAKVSRSLRLSLHKGLTRLNACHYIKTYENEPSHSQLLLSMAKLDFNILQKQHQKELQDVTRWWNSLEVPKNFPFTRDRITECYFWIIGVYFEPEYELARNILTKVIGLISIMDDIYDVHGTMNELELLTDVINEWDIGAINKLPADYLKVYYKAFLDIYKYIEETLEGQGRSYRFPYAKEAMKHQAMSYFKEAQWLHQNYTPTVEEYMLLSLESSGYGTLNISSLIGMGDVANKDVFEWLFSDPKILKASKLIARLKNDIVSHTLEQERGHVSSAVECYMKQYKFTEEEAKAAIQKQIDDAWKDIHGECFSPTAAPLPIITRILNFTRVIELMYSSNSDGYTHSNTALKSYIASLFVNPISSS